MNRIFKHEDFTFNVKVELNIKAERRPNGLVWHRITISDMGSSNWLQTKEVEEFWLMSAIKDFEDLAKQYVDAKDTRPEIIKKLSACGFS